MRNKSKIKHTFSLLPLLSKLRFSWLLHVCPPHLWVGQVDGEWGCDKFIMIQVCCSFPLMPFPCSIAASLLWDTILHELLQQGSFPWDATLPELLQYKTPQAAASIFILPALSHLPSDIIPSPLWRIYFKIIIKIYIHHTSYTKLMYTDKEYNPPFVPTPQYNSLTSQQPPQQPPCCQTLPNKLNLNTLSLCVSSTNLMKNNFMSSLSKHTKNP